MDNKIIIGLIGLIIAFSGFGFTILATRKIKKSFPLGYTLTIIWPLLFVCFVVFAYGNKVFELFGISIVIGVVGEFITGSTYYKITGERLWDYKRLDFNGQTSLLMIPLWGSAGVLFWFFSKILKI